jgi:hypothetical protein
VPTGRFSNRPQDIVDGLEECREILQQAGIGINSDKNGFFAKAGHNGTHTNAFFRELIAGLRLAKREGTVATYMQNLKNSLK